MDDVFAGFAAGELRDGLRNARDLANMLHLVEERVAPYCAAARNAGHTEDGLAVSLGVSREFARALCALDPVSAVRALVSPREDGVCDRPLIPDAPRAGSSDGHPKNTELDSRSRLAGCARYPQPLLVSATWRGGSPPRW